MKLQHGILLMVMLFLAACSTPTPTGPSITVQEPWSRPAVSGEMSGVGGIFMTLFNAGETADRLIAARSDVAATVELHETIMENDVMKMRPVPAIEIPAGGQVELKPGRYHIMLIGLKQELQPGDKIKVTLTFEQSGEMTIEAEVRAP